MKKDFIWRSALLCHHLVQVNKKLMFDFGYAAAVLRGESIDSDDNPIPWFTYPCIDYLKNLDLRDKSVFEWGSGNSTLFWANRCKDVTSVENDQAYYKKNKCRLKHNIRLFLRVKSNEYVCTIAECNKKFDIIVVDGRWRLDCAKLAIKYVTDDGIIILDNSDWHFKSTRFLREQNLIQVDFSGFGALNAYTWATSVFFKRDAKFNSIEENQPVWPPGAPRVYAE
jgi:hypothetical protein